MTKQFFTIFLRIAIIFMGLGVFGFVVLLTVLWKDIATEFPRYSYSVYAIFTLMYIAALPFFMGIYNAWRLLKLIDRGRIFTAMSVTMIKNIAVSAAFVSAVCLVSMPFFYIWAENDDAPGLIVICMVLVAASLVVAVFAALMQKLVGEAVALKSENELTV